MLTIDIVQRVVRYIHIGFLSTIAMFVFVVEFSIRPVVNPANRGLHIIFVVICIVILNSLVYVRQNFIATSMETLRADPTNQLALKRWQGGHLVTFAGCEAVALFGFVSRVLGAPKLFGFALFGVAIYTLVAYRPKPILEQ